MKILILAIILAAPAVQANDETQQIENAFQMAWCSGFLAAVGTDGHARGYMIAAGMLAESLLTVDTDALVQVLEWRMADGADWVETNQHALASGELASKAQRCIDINPLVVKLVTAWRVAGVTK